MARVTVPADNQKEVFLLSRRRCCICFGLDGDLGVKQGQIAHLDQDNTNYDLDNLAFLCLPHHDQYDGKTSQSKGLQKSEVKQFRKELYGKIAEGPPDELARPKKESSLPAPASSSAEAHATISPTISPVIAPVFAVNYGPGAPQSQGRPEPEERRPVHVEFAPWEGQFEKMFLSITNRGTAQIFHAQCRILTRRNDPNPQHLMTLDLQWQYGGEGKHLVRGQAGNLLIASAGEDKPRGMEWMKIEGALGHHGPESRWVWSDKKRPEYDLEITILGDKSDQPQSERFTLRAGSSRALEMFKTASVGASGKRSPREEARELADDLRALLNELGPRPAPERSPDQDDLEFHRYASSQIGPWVQRLVAAWAGRFADRAQRTRHLLAEYNAVDFELDRAIDSPKDEKNILFIADKFLILSSRADTEQPEKPEITARNVRPAIKLKEPGAIYIESVSQNWGDTHFDSVPFLKVRFVNDPAGPYPSAKAVDVRATINYYRSSDNAHLLSIDGRWADSDQPSAISPLASKSHLLPITFGIGEAHSLDIAYRDAQTGQYFA